MTDVTAPAPLLTALPPAGDPDAVYAAFAEWAESTGRPLYPAQDEAHP